MSAGCDTAATAYGGAAGTTIRQYCCGTCGGPNASPPATGPAPPPVCVASACREFDWQNDGSDVDDDCCAIAVTDPTVDHSGGYCSTGYTYTQGPPCAHLPDGRTAYTTCCEPDVAAPEPESEEQQQGPESFTSELEPEAAVPTRSPIEQIKGPCLSI